MLFPLCHAVADVPNTNTDAFTLSWDTDSCESICLGVVSDLAFSGSFHLFDIQTVLHFWGSTVIRGSESLANMNLLTLLLNSSSMAFRISLIVAFVIPSDLSHCLMFTHCVSPAPRLVSFDVVVSAPVVPVAMVSWLLFAIGFFQFLLVGVHYWSLVLFGGPSNLIDALV